MENTNNPYAELEQKYSNNMTQQNDLLNQQSTIQNQQIDANTNQTLSEIEHQKKYAQQEFNKEARGAYQDYQKAINPYGVQAENMFSNGLGNSGYSETSKLNAFNTYQNRYATARQSTDRMMDEFNNEMAQARLEGNREKAEVALNKLQTQMDNLWNQLSLDTSLTQNKVGYNQWLKEFEYQKDQDALANALAREQFEYQKQQDAISNSRNYYNNGATLVDSNNEIQDTTENNNQDYVENNQVSESQLNNITGNVIPSGLRVKDFANWAYANNWKF